MIFMIIMILINQWACYYLDISSVYCSVILCENYLCKHTLENLILPIHTLPDDQYFPLKYLSSMFTQIYFKYMITSSRLLNIFKPYNIWPEEKSSSPILFRKGFSCIFYAFSFFIKCYWQIIFPIFSPHISLSSLHISSSISLSFHVQLS